MYDDIIILLSLSRGNFLYGCVLYIHVQLLICVCSVICTQLKNTVQNISPGFHCLRMCLIRAHFIRRRMQMTSPWSYRLASDVLNTEQAAR